MINLNQSEAPRGPRIALSDLEAWIVQPSCVLAVAAVCGVVAVLMRNLSLALLSVFSLTIGLFSGLALLAAVSHARIGIVSARAMGNSPSGAPEGRPVPGQNAVDVAMAIYGISKPADAEQPIFDSKLQDRGLTVKSSWFGKTQVYIGPSAFSSWSMLGSTLAHEVEIHCRQNFPLIFIKDQIGLDGTSDAEREAYRYEILNASRFGLNGRDTSLIAATVDYYYPRGK